VLTLETSTAWGGFIAVESPTAVGATTTTEIDLFNPGGCVARVDTSATGQACAKAYNELQECEFASCVPYCPVASQSDQAGEDALLGSGTSNGCLGDADTAICATYVTAVQTACATESNDAGTGAFDKCENLISDASTATGALPLAFEQYLGLLCGGYDAGL